MDYLKMIGTLEATRNNLDLIRDAIMDTIDICAEEDVVISALIDQLKAEYKEVIA